MATKRHDIWSGPIIGYGNASGMSAGGKFKRPDDVDFSPKAEAKKSATRKPKAALNKNVKGKVNTTKKKAKNKNLHFKALISDDHLTLALFGRKSYKMHSIGARCNAKNIGQAWRIEDLW